MTALRQREGYLLRLINVGLRGFTLLSKFLLIFVLAKYLEPRDLGLYGLVVATVAYAMYPLGFDFYTYSTRELLKRERSEWGKLLKSQAFLHFTLYSVFLPLLALVFYFELLPWDIIFWFYAILVLEHLNQELMRLLIALSEQLTATTALFIRQGSWAVALAFWMYADADARNIESILLSWFSGGLFALLLSLYKIKAMGVGGWSSSIDVKWIKRGVFVAVPLFFSSLALNGVFTIDRYWFESLVGLEILGAYVLFMGMAAALISFMDAGIFSFKYPAMISSFNKGLCDSFRKNTESMLIQVIVFLAIYILVVSSLLGLVLELIGKELYLENVDIFYWLVLVMGIQAVSNVPHYALYAQGKDSPIIASHLVSLFLFIPIVIFLSAFSKYHAVPAALCVIQSIILVWKAACYYKYIPKEYRIYKF